MAMPDNETDYLVIGSGACGLAFADTLVAETDAHVTVVDRHGLPGGHWNDAYAFVTLHQPSAFYGVNSLSLGSGRRDSAGLNQGLYELATGAEVRAYYEQVMQQRLLPSGRVRYLPLHNHLGGGVVESLLSGDRTTLNVRRRLVDARHHSPAVPSTQPPRYAVAPGVHLVPPNALPGLWHGTQQMAAPPRHFAVIGAGKTAMDTCIWLLQHGAPAEAITWVVPRDAWVINRLTMQSGPEFFHETIGSQADQMEAFAQAQSITDLFLRMEACGALLRIHPEHQPTMFHYATLSVGEVQLLRQIRHVVRKGHVLALEPGAMRLAQGREPLPHYTLCIDCTASALNLAPAQPVFQDGRIVLQVVRMPQPTFSAALIAHLEVRSGDDDAAKNRLCTPLPFPKTLADYPRTTLGNMRNQMLWGQDKGLRDWIRASRLDGMGKLMASAARDDAAQQAVIARLREHAPAAMANLQKLASAAAEPA